MALRKTPRESALARVRDLDAQAAQWVARRDSALSELAVLEATLGEVALSDPVSAQALPGQMQVLRDRAGVSARALEAVSGKALAARRDALRAEADEMGPQVDAARAAVDEHESGVARCLSALQDFSGQEYTPRTNHDDLAEQEMHETGRITVSIPKVLALRDVLARVQIARDLLLASVQGRDLRSAVPAAFESASLFRDPFEVPVFRFEDLPASLHPTRGLIPAVEFVDPQGQAEDGARQVRAELAKYQGQVAAFEAALARLAEEVEAAEFEGSKRELRLQIGEVEKQRDCAMRDAASRVEQLAAIEGSGAVMTSAA